MVLQEEAAGKEKRTVFDPLVEGCFLKNESDMMGS